MTKGLTLPLGAAAFSATPVLAGCASDAESEPDETPTEHEDHGETTEYNGDGNEHMDPPEDGGPVPEDMAESTDPEHTVGEEVTLTADHMPGMDGATATIVGAYDTFTYSADYTRTTGGEPVTDHKWVVHEEIEDAGDQWLEDGTEVTLAADHMEGMDGATATVFSSTEETVYVVDVDTEDMTMTNHKWVMESEFEPTS